MRSAFALGVLALGMGIPLCAQEGQSDATKTRAAIAPLVFQSESTTTTLPDSNARAFSSGFVVKLPAMDPPAGSATAALPRPHVKTYSSGFEVKLPDLLAHADTAPKP